MTIDARGKRMYKVKDVQTIAHAVKTIANFPVADPKNHEALALVELAKAAVALVSE